MYKCMIQIHIEISIYVCHNSHMAPNGQDVNIDFVRLYLFAKPSDRHYNYIQSLSKKRMQNTQIILNFLDLKLLC